jgi:hypothetical protein
MIENILPLRQSRPCSEDSSFEIVDREYMLEYKLDDCNALNREIFPKEYHTNHLYRSFYEFFGLAVDLCGDDVEIRQKT